MGLSTLLVVVFFSLVLFGCTSLAIRESPRNLNLLIPQENTNNIGYFMSLTNDQPIPEALEGLIPTEITGTKESKLDMGNDQPLDVVHLNHQNSIPPYFKKNFERKPNLGTWFYTPKTSE